MGAGVLRFTFFIEAIVARTNYIVFKRRRVAAATRSREVGIDTLFFVQSTARYSYYPS